MPEASANRVLHYLYRWFCFNKLKLNESKTCLLFHTHQRVQNVTCNISVNRIEIVQQNKAKFLGVYIYVVQFVMGRQL